MITYTITETVHDKLISIASSERSKHDILLLTLADVYTAEHSAESQKITALIESLMLVTRNHRHVTFSLTEGESEYLVSLMVSEIGEFKILYDVLHNSDDDGVHNLALAFKQEAETIEGLIQYLTESGTKK